MDVVKLIRAVKNREPLWNRQHSHYNDRDISGALWNEVSGEIGVDVDSAKYKWRGLRDTFRGELKKLNRSHLRAVASSDVLSTNWEYFHEMKFVKDQIYLNKKMHEVTVKEEFLCEPLDIANICSAEVKEETQELNYSENDTQANSLGGDSKKRSSDSEVDSTSEKRSTSHYYIRRPKVEDDNYSFLMSLLPQLKSLPVTRNLFARLKIQEMLFTEIVSLQHYDDN